MVVRRVCVCVCWWVCTWSCYVCYMFICNTNALLLLMTAKASKINIQDVAGINQGNDSHDEMHLFFPGALVTHIWSRLKTIHRSYNKIRWYHFKHFQFITSNCWSLISCLKKKREKERKRMNERNSWITYTFSPKCLIQLKCWDHYCQSINLMLKLIIFRLNAAYTKDYHYP